MTEPEQHEEKAPTILKLGDLKRLITDIFDSKEAERERSRQQPEGEQRRAPRGYQQREEPRGRSSEEEVAAALKKLEAEKAERAEKDALRSDVEELKADKKNRDERPPVEHRRVERFMKWHAD